MSYIVHLGDCLAGMAGLADGSVNSVITDPPYDAITHSRGTNKSLVRRSDGGPDVGAIPFDALGAEAPIAAAISRVARRWAVVFCADRQIDRWCAGFEATGWRILRVAVWVKPDAMPQFSGDRPGHGWEPMIVAHAPGRSRWNGGGMKGVYECPRIDRDSGFHHPTQKPLDLMLALVRDFTDPGDLVCDPFAGSGTTGVACKRLGRRFIGFEKDPKYAAIATKRIENAREQFGLAGIGA